MNTTLKWAVVKFNYFINAVVFIMNPDVGCNLRQTVQSRQKSYSFWSVVQLEHKEEG